MTGLPFFESQVVLSDFKQAVEIYLGKNNVYLSFLFPHCEVTSIIFFLQLSYSFCLYSSTWHLAVLFDTVSMFQCWLFKKKVGTFFGHGSFGICVFFQL